MMLVRQHHAGVILKSLLLVDQAEYGSSLSDSEAAEQVGCTRRTVEMVRERCVMEGLSVALERKKRPLPRQIAMIRFIALPNFSDVSIGIVEYCSLLLIRTVSTIGERQYSHQR